MKRTYLFRSLFFISFFLATTQTYAWVYPEHRQIMLLAIQNLSPEFRLTLDNIWAEARMGYTERLTSSVIEPSQGIKPKQLDYASWTGIAGDHSTSPENLLYNVLKTGWILKVANIAAQLQMDMAKSKNNSQHVNAIRNSDIKLQRADLEYATRAGKNSVHFLLARPDVKTDAKTYLLSCLAEGKELNAIGAYALFHTTALQKASRYATENLSAEDKSALILAALADEAFALHFLQDVYASGHIAGCWGAASVRKGTHDYYNEKGLEVVCWDGNRTIQKGDAYMRAQDAEVAAANIKISLEQLLKVATGQLIADFSNANIPSSNLADSFNVGKNMVMPARNFNPEILIVTLQKTPVPGLATGLGELPRFRSELGMFSGIASSLNANTIYGGFGKNQTQTGAVGGIDANIRFGLGLDGVLNQAGDGLVFLQCGWRQDASSTNQFINTDPSFPSNSITSAIPGRSAFSLRIRMPFWLIPGDLLVAGPILMLLSPKTLSKMAVTAGNGGAISWQSGIATSIGRFQFILGREMGVSFYGRGKLNDALLIPISDTKASLIEYSSTRFDFPILEYRPFRTFSLNQSSSITFQLTAGFDIPHSSSVIVPAGSPVPELKTIWHSGIRLEFDWRHYFN